MPKKLMATHVTDEMHCFLEQLALAGMRPNKLYLHDKITRCNSLTTQSCETVSPLKSDRFISLHIYGIGIIFYYIGNSR